MGKNYTRAFCRAGLLTSSQRFSRAGGNRWPSAENEGRAASPPSPERAFGPPAVYVEALRPPHLPGLRRGRSLHFPRGCRGRVVIGSFFGKVPLGRLRRPLPYAGPLRPPDPQGNSFCGERVPRKPGGGNPPPPPADRRTSRYAEHRRLKNAAVAHSRSAPTHANVRLSPNGRAGVFIRVQPAEITLLPKCREKIAITKAPLPG